MMIPFTKLQGLGNDFILIDERDKPSVFKPDMVTSFCHRHLGIGADGVILLYPDFVADARMVIFNADGSRPEMCGNAVRCVGIYLQQLQGGSDFSIQTDSGIKTVFLHDSQCKVEMGLPVFEPEKIPVSSSHHELRIPIQGQFVDGMALSMGNPHLVIPVQELNDPVTQWGPLLETHSMFPQKVNVEFVKWIDVHTLQVIVWERGVGYTQACGTGACAAAVAMMLMKRCQSPVSVHFSKGSLLIEWDGLSSVFMTGPAEKVFTGQKEI